MTNDVSSISKAINSANIQDSWQDDINIWKTWEGKRVSVKKIRVHLKKRHICEKADFNDSDYPDSNSKDWRVKLNRTNTLFETKKVTSLFV